MRRVSHPSARPEKQARTAPVGCSAMPPRRVLLLGEGDLNEETAAALRAAEASVARLEDPTH